MRRLPSLILSAIALAGLAPAVAQAQTVTLASAAREGSPQQVREAVAQGANPNGLLPDGETPLGVAATSNDDPDVIDALVKAGAQVDATDATGMTPLMWAAAENPNPDVTTALLAAGADPNARNVIGMTPLMFAAKENPEPKVAARLLAAGAKVNARDINGMTALLYASADNDLPTLIAELLGAGADPRLASASGKSALEYARANPALQGTTAIAELQKGASAALPAAGAPGEGNQPATANVKAQQPPTEAQHRVEVGSALPTASAPAAHATALSGRSPSPSATDELNRGGLVIDIKPEARHPANVWIALSGAGRQHFFRTSPATPVTTDLRAGSYQVRAAFDNDTGTGYAGTATIVAGRQTTITIPLRYSPAFVASLNERYDSLRQQLHRDRSLTLPRMEGQRAVRGRQGAVVEGLGVATAGLAGLFYYLSTTSPSSSQAFRSAAIVGGGFSGGLLLWGTGLLLSRPSQGEIERLKAEDRELDTQLHRLALTKESTSR